MRTISRTRSFKRDYKREKSAQHGPKLDDLLRAVLEPLIADEPPPIQYRDHALSGEWVKGGYRDCHVRPDLVLIYRKPNANTLELVRLGSHSELSL